MKVRINKEARDAKLTALAAERLADPAFFSKMKARDIELSKMPVAKLRDLIHANTCRVCDFRSASKNECWFDIMSSEFGKHSVLAYVSI